MVDIFKRCTNLSTNKNLNYRLRPVVLMGENIN